MTQKPKAIDKAPHVIITLTDERGINGLGGNIHLRTEPGKGTKAVANVVAYIRISKEEAGSTSLTTQENAIRQWAAANGHEVKALFADEGISGGVQPLKRDGAAAAIREARKRGNGLLVVSKLDRLSRDLSDVLELVDTHLARRATLISVSESFDASTPAGRMFLQLLGTFGEFERNKIRERTREALETRRREGRKTGGAQAPFGYRVDKAGMLQPLAGEQKVLKEARKLREGGLSFAKVAAALNDKGMTRREGKPWNAPKLFECLQADDRRKADRGES